MRTAIISTAILAATAALALIVSMLYDAWQVSHAATAYVVIALPTAVAVIWLSLLRDYRRREDRRARLFARVRGE